MVTTYLAVVHPSSQGPSHLVGKELFKMSFFL